MIDMGICLSIFLIVGWYSLVEGLPSKYKIAILRPFLGKTTLIYNAELFEKGIYINDPGPVHIENTCIADTDIGIRIFADPYSNLSFFKKLTVSDARIGIQIDSPQKSSLENFHLEGTHDVY